MLIKPFPMVEKAVKEIIETAYPAAAGHVGGDLAYDGEPLYVFIGLVGGGSSDQIEGTWVLDVDCFSPTYSQAMTHALAIEALMIGHHETGILRLDSSTPNEPPLERPWGGDDAFRVGSTFVITARRPA